METFFIFSWLLSGITIVFGLVYLTIGVMYKNRKKISIAILSLALGIVSFCLPYIFIINELKKA